MRLILILTASILLLSPLVGAQESEGNVPRVRFTAATNDNGTGGYLRGPMGVYSDESTGEVFVAATGNHRIIVYDRDLNFKYSMEHTITDPFSGRVVRGEPRSIAVTREGDLYVVDNLADYLDVLNFRGESVARIYPDLLLGDTLLQLKPEIVTMDEDENIYLSISGDLQTILVIDKDYRLKRRIGNRGDKPSEFSAPVGLAVRRGQVYVSDLYSVPAVKVFDTLGQFQYGFGGHDVDREDLSMAAGVCVISDSVGNETIWVSDALRQVIKVFSKDGLFLTNISGYGERIGELTYPAGLTVARNNTFYVVEKVLGRVQRFEIK